MKNFLLSAAALMAAMTMNAQEVCVFNADNAMVLDSDNGTVLAAGTVIGETASIVAKVGADDTYKPQSATFTVNGTDITGGLQGATNPKDADGGVPATTLVQPVCGAFLVFEAKADGFLYVMHKAMSNKAYTVFEKGTAISYTFTAIGDAATDLGAVYSFTLPYEVENEQFVVKNSIEWAEQEFLKATAPDKYAARWTTSDDGTQAWDPIKINGLGVIKFPVYKDCKYIVNANGTKITAAGFVFSTADNVAISSDGITITGQEFETDGIRYKIGKNNTVSVVSREAKYSGDVVLPGSVEFNGNTYIVTVIADYAFSGCSGLNTLTLPNSVTSIGRQAFAGCSGLTTIVSEIANPFAIDDGFDEDIYAKTMLIVPPGKKSAYQNTAGWKQFTNIVEAGQGGIIGYRFEADGIRYEIGEYNCVTVIPNGYSGDIVIPNQVTFNGCNYTVTSIRYSAFEGCNGLKSVIIPNSVTYIGSSAFSDCNDLDSVYIPSSVTYIGSYAFDGWHGHAVYITDLEAWCRIHFEDVYANPLRLGILYLNGSEIKDLVIPSGITSIGNYAFIGYRGTSITIPDGVTSIGHRAFSDCRGLETITSEIQNPFAIDESVFNCSDKELYATATLIVPAGTKSAYQNTAGWNKFQNIVEVGGVGYEFEYNGIRYKIGENNTVSVVLRDEKYSGNVVIPSSVDYNGNPYNVTSIGNNAFYGCSDLTSITIPNSVTSIGEGAFIDCKELKTVVSEIEVPFAINAVFSNTATATLIVPFGTKAAYQSTAGWNEFQNIVEVSEVGKEFEADGIRYKIGENNTVSVILKDTYYSGDIVIPMWVDYKNKQYKVTSIGNSAFEGCVDLTSVSLPNSLTRIGNGAFWECSSLKSVVIPDGVTTIGEGAFRNCFNLVSVDIPNSVTSIGSSAFGNCDNLTQISSGIEDPFAIEEGVFPTSVYNNASLLVPSGKKSAYQNTAGWKRFQKIYHVDGIYTLTYYVDGKEYKSVKYSFGSEITPEAEPAKTGYTFSGWSDVPKTMPADNVTVTGTFTANKYELTYKIDGEVYVTYQIEYGTPITPEAEPTKEGYTFSGWSYIPETMPAVEVNVFGSFTVNQYTITYVIDGETYTTVTVDFNSKIVPPTPPSKDGFDFAWEEYPETMPASDITINGAYTTTGILSIAVESGKAKIFTLDGRQVDTLQKGINIIRMDDGTTKKVVLGK